MYQVLLVDDDMLVRMFLTEMIKWEDYGFSVVGAARDGEEALEMMESLHPDIVLTDISMPGMDGVELIRRLRADRFEGVINVLSCHDDFELVKNAMKYGADDYLLKNHLDDKTAGEFLDKICEQIKDKQMESREERREPDREYIVRRELFEKVLKGLHDEEVIKKQMERAGIKGKYRRVMAALLQPMEAGGSIDPLLAPCKQLLEDRSGELIYIREDLMVLLVDLSRISSESRANEEYNQMITQIQRQALEYLNMELAVGGSGVCDGQMAVITALRQADRAMENRFYGKGRWQYGHTEELPGAAKRFVMELPQLMGKADDNTIRIRYSAVCQGIHEKRVKVKKVREWIKACDRAVGYQREEGWNKDRYLWEDYKDAVEDYLKRRNEERQSQLPEDISPTVRRAAAFIQEHFSEQIDLRQVSEQVNLSPAYFSTLFKQEMKMGFAEFLSKQRLRWVCLQMRETDGTAKEIAMDAGFQDYPYFCKIFKKNVGCSPTAYRKSLGDRN